MTDNRNQQQTSIDDRAANRNTPSPDHQNTAGDQQDNPQEGSQWSNYRTWELGGQQQDKSFSPDKESSGGNFIEFG